MRMKKMATLIAVMTLLVLPATNVFASYVTFKDFKFTTCPSAENWTIVTSKTKPDNEQNWYVTLTSQSGLISNSCRALVMSNDSTSDIGNYVPYPLYSTTTSSGAIGYGKTVYTGHTYHLFITGNENNYGTYTITISGRYTS